jgi:general secretion pathway protein F
MDATQSFAYRAARRDGTLVRGRVDAASRDAAAKLLTTRGLYPVQLAMEARTARRRTGIPAGDLALSLRVLADLLDSGLPIARALQALESLAPPRFARALPGIREGVREGKSLGRAMDEASLALPSVVVGVIHAGERGSGLPAAVRHAAELCDDAAATRAAIRGALAYPITLAVFGTATVALLVEVVLPSFATILGDLGQTLPASTRFVLTVAATVRVGTAPTLVVAAVSAAFWYSWVSTTDGRLRWESLLLVLPVSGQPRRAAAVARFCSALSALLQSGVPLVAALKSAAHATGNAALEPRVLAARTDVEHGGRLSDALAARDAATPVVHRLVRAGEESGRLATMLAHAARLERDRAAREVRNAVRLLEPLLIVGFGGVVALVAAALFQALYSVRPGT